MTQTYRASTLLFCASLLLSGASARAQLAKPEQLAEDLARHSANPALFAQELPPKWDAQGKLIPTSRSRFSQAETASGAFVGQKAGVGPQGTNANGQGHATDPNASPIESGDHADALTGTLTYDSLSAMLDAGVTQGGVETQPWSSDYWPLFSGTIGNRYADPAFPASADWKQNSDYVLGNLGNASSASGMDNLSPAEKYDLVVGDPNFTLTRQMFDQGRAYYEKTGSVEGWMGICHGWAPASFMVPRPVSKIEVLAADGKTKITFYPDDLKALEDALWANANFPSRFIGHRCESKDPAVDPANGHITDPACLDNNPATWHLAVVNQLGKGHKPFVMDASNDYQVWNQPVISYSYTLFNPQTKAVTTKIAEAKAQLADYATDPYKKYRSPGATWVVGVSMEVKYLSEVSPTHQDKNTPQDDSIETVRYLYDLELDAGENLIGGEWYSTAHPDFLWTPEADAQALSPEDRKLQQNYPTLSWKGDAVVPAAWKAAARNASQRGMPLAKVLNTLITLSRIGL